MDLSYPGEGKLQIAPFLAPLKVEYYYTESNPTKLVLENSDKDLKLIIGNEFGPVLIDGDDPGEDHIAVLSFSKGIEVALNCRIHNDF